MEDDYWFWAYEVKAKQPAEWLIQAYELKRSADILWDQFIGDMEQFQTRGLDTSVPWGPHATGDAAMMLSGFAIENLVKGILVGRDPTRVEGGRLKEWSGSGHDLPNLFREAGIEFTDIEEQAFVD